MNSSHLVVWYSFQIEDFQPSNLFRSTLELYEYFKHDLYRLLFNEMENVFK